MMTNEKVVLAARGTRNFISQFFPDGVEAARTEPAGVAQKSLSVIVAHSLWCCDEIEILVAQGRREKAMRWLGFIQGVAWALGTATIEELKDLNKPDTQEGGD